MDDMFPTINESFYAVKTYGNKLSVGTVVGYPQGANTTSVKIAEGLDAIDNGAAELDLVMNISRLRKAIMIMSKTRSRNL